MSLVVCILDGWGEAPPGPCNAITLAKTPVINRLRQEGLVTFLEASGPAVGLPEGQMGNSEVGHMTIGAGRRIPQELPRISEALAPAQRGNFFKDAEVFQSFIGVLKARGGTAHLMGLLSPGGVHAHQDHIPPLVEALVGAGIPVRLHGFLDGRDTPPQSAEEYIQRLEAALKPLHGWAWGTLAGRYYAMDRDHHWARTRESYAAITLGKGAYFAHPEGVIQEAYAHGIMDEFIRPAVLGDYKGMAPQDGILCWNFRADRVRQLLHLFVDPTAQEREELPFLNPIALGMSPYSTALDARMQTLFPKEVHAHFLGEILSQHHVTQLRVAETEKYAHVTFFLNGGREEPFPGEKRILVPSPQVATYDLAPAMSAQEVGAAVAAHIPETDVIFVNFANTDMVGHTGDLQATIAAVEAVDQALGVIVAALSETGGMILVTADHGNAEHMRDPETQGPHTAHTSALVPCIFRSFGPCVHPVFASVPAPSLKDLAPTVLALLQIPQPVEMTGTPLFQRGEASCAG